MTTEEKAKAYDEAIERAKKEWSNNLDNAYKNYRERLEIIFPELKESDDEKTRKALISFLKSPFVDENITDEKVAPWLAWLEKQGEQKPTTVDIDKMVDDYANRRECGNEEFGKPLPCMIRAYKQGLNDAIRKVALITAWSEEDERLRKTTIAFLKDFAEQGYENAVECIDWLEKQGEKDKKEINNFEVIPGLYKCVHRMFDGTPDGKLLFEVGNVYKCLSKHDRAEFEVSYGHSVYLEDPVVCKHFIPSEKQGERKPIVKIEPKFKVGDWITNGFDCTFQIASIEDGIYYDTNDCGSDIESTDKYYRLWTLEDAKDCDVLYFSDETIVIFKDLYNATTFHSYCHIEDNVFDISKDDMPDWWEGKGFKPATKEQRELLFKKMKEAGYEWDAEKKEPKKIEQNIGWSKEDETSIAINNPDAYRIGFADGEAHAKEEMAQAKEALYDKPAWSEEDEKNWRGVIDEIEANKSSAPDYDVKTYDRFLSWLKSIKQRLGGEK